MATAVHHASLATFVHVQVPVFQKDAQLDLIWQRLDLPPVVTAHRAIKIFIPIKLLLL